MCEKPKDWPVNAIECQLENINTQIEKFKREPSYKTKEVLIALISNYDMNQQSFLGQFRTTKYEVALLNQLYIESHILQINSLKIFILDLVGKKTYLQKQVAMISDFYKPLEVEFFEGLLPVLKLYYWVYQACVIERGKKFSEQLLSVVEDIINNSKANDSKDDFKEVLGIVTQGCIAIVNDISYFRCAKLADMWAFTREEMYNIFSFIAKLIKMNGDSPIVRPLKGVLMTSISNYILKSRNNYNRDYICKYVSSDVAKASINNHQIWMSNIESLNDEREQRVIPELFEQNGWNEYSWVKDIDFSSKRKYYVSSFSKSIKNEQMKTAYGKCIYGFKDDRIAELLAPIMLKKLPDDKIYPAVSQVLSFDVLYDREEAKKEINFLCSIIDCFDMDGSDKKRFLEDIMQYWLLSVKDSQWSYENERRYVLFLYDQYEYIEMDDSDDKMLKLKTSLFIEPDFILGDNPVKEYLKMMVDNKRDVISMKPYLFCKECFNRDFDIAASTRDDSKCPICESKNVSVEKPRGVL